MSSKSKFIILSYTVSKFAHFLRHSLVGWLIEKLMESLAADFDEGKDDG